jgi:hypothetical protein
MRDISTDDLVQTLIIKTQAHERALCVYAVHPTAQNANAVNARARDQKNAIRALNTHLRECLRMATRHQVKVPIGAMVIKKKLSARTLNALRNHKVMRPETCTVEELLRIPDIGVSGVAQIAHRSYIHPVNWPELEQ